MTHDGNPLGNPFAWAFTPYSSIKCMLSNFYHIKWTKFELLINTKTENTYTLRIDNKINIHYIHYKYNPLCIKPLINGHDVEYNKIWNYVVEKYIIRLNRMVESKIKPSFLILQNEYSGSTQEFNTLYQNTPYTDFNICWGVREDNKISLKPNTIMIRKGELPIQIVKRCYSDIIKCLT